MLTDIMEFYLTVRNHLRLNVMPPVRDIFTDAAIEAIANAKDNDYGRRVRLPDGRERSTGELVKLWNLEGFLEDYSD